MYTLSGIVFKLGAAVHLLVDVWEACYNPFHNAAKLAPDFWASVSSPSIGFIS